MSERTTLEEIHIKNIGVISQASLELDKGLTVLTGETGAGKTMILTALNLVLGGKTDNSLVRSGEERLSASALFRIPKGLSNHFENFGLEIENDSLAISRNLTKEGKSKALANGVSVSASLLGQVSEHLVEIHGQSSNLSIAKSSRQRELVDRYAGPQLVEKLKDYQKNLSNFQETKKRIVDLKANVSSREQLSASLKEFADTFSKLNPRLNELSEVQDEISRLSSVEELRISVTQALNSLEHEESGVLTSLAQAKRELDSSKDKDSHLERFSDDFNDAFFILADLLPNLTSYVQSLEADPERLDFLQERKAALTAFIKKWSPDAVGDEALKTLTEKHQNVSSQLEDLRGGDERIQALENELLAIKKLLLASAADLSNYRKVSSEKLSNDVSSEMHALSMPNTNLVIKVASPDYSATMKESDFTNFGCDEISMYLQTHKESPLVAIAKGASGGEMSRVMLALEVVLAATNPVGTYIFDEVDAGVGGAAAIEVGRRLHLLSKNAQVIVVTHLPQVAAWGDRHYVVEKSIDGTVISSGITSVDGESRISEIARMLAGLQESSSAKEHASELLKLRLGG